MACALVRAPGSHPLPPLRPPLLQALTPLVEGILQTDMKRFREYALAQQNVQA